MSTSVLDFSFSDLTEMADIYDEEPREGKTKEQTKKAPKWPVTTLRLNNNGLSGFENLPQVLDNILWDLSSVTMLDLSLNGFTALSSELACLSNLGILYLHGNAIASLKEVKKLVVFEKLRSLSLHGNPIEKETGYRTFVISVLPQLKKLDFTTITAADRERTETWRQVHAPKRLAKSLQKKPAQSP